MEVRTFVRIQWVIWDHLLAFKAELSRSKLYFSFRAEQHAKNNYELIMQSALFFSFVLFSSPPRSLFRLNHVRKVRTTCSHSRFSLQAIILGFFYRSVGLCCSCFSVAMGDRGYFRWVKRKRRQNSNRTRTIAGSPLSSYSRANLGITHTESMFAGYYPTPSKQG